jgi:hypothetical protein
MSRRCPCAVWNRLHAQSGSGKTLPLAEFIIYDLAMYLTSRTGLISFNDELKDPCGKWSSFTINRLAADSPSDLETRGIINAVFTIALSGFTPVHYDMGYGLWGRRRR